MAFLVSRYLLPDLTVSRSLSLSWVLPLFLRNYLIMLLVAGGLHLYFFTYRGQGKRLKYLAREDFEKSGKFSFRSQLRDNIFWSLASGATIWSIYETGYLWALGNGSGPSVLHSGTPIGIRSLVAVYTHTCLLPFLSDSPVAALAAALQKRAPVASSEYSHWPWSGMSMHPVLIYISSVLVHFVIPSHPIVFLVHIYSRCLGPAFSHSGFEKLLVKDKVAIDSGLSPSIASSLFQATTVRSTAPWDRWFGSYHDGSDEATVRVREQRRRMYRDRIPG